ncbi:MAG: Uma2 family endonuclease [Planctomycetes bacterium]|nr:Uma2 family endonuclease [Planctomycetota bacterium]
MIRMNATSRKSRIGRKVRMSERDYLRRVDAPGSVSEIFDGVLQVSPSPIPSHSYWQRLIFRHLDQYSILNPRSINYVDQDNDVVIGGRAGATRPRPDITAYRDFPSLEELVKRDDWSYFCPILVVEIVSRRRIKKDIERNRNLYWAAGGIAEYWIVDPTKDAKRPTMTALYRLIGRPDWTQKRFAFTDEYQSSVLEGLSICLKELHARR